MVRGGRDRLRCSMIAGELKASALPSPSTHLSMYPHEKQVSGCIRKHYAAFHFTRWLNEITFDVFKMLLYHQKVMYWIFSLYGVIKKVIQTPNNTTSTKQYSYKYYNMYCKNCHWNTQYILPLIGSILFFMWNLTCVPEGVINLVQYFCIKLLETLLSLLFVGVKIPLFISCF